ncbi:hypothetical protein PTSG_12906 [Salpingoeca rosetta]|uniref:Trafficking protein particle complex subunit 11 domain-containing protein n=1 Tax=Salpingoeca rosetta (strain ATCC 50818 / BSB-021) TaxID=946362 RepID=F2ULN6_SALR5|nr:uncharacterized protein PTSG_12906 [Salpingoeca rosetta]EGD78035.1 hypothetical protein PTSG_12906 [Salpingoeca rosetta]|eukprot:XP_004990097.1 hypothetical protein PTSG_12906 [Salpingoeca rosetta]
MAAVLKEQDDLLVPTLAVPTTPLVKVIGLHVGENEKHKVFWETLQKRVEQGETVVRYERCTPDTINFPPRKDKPQRQLGITEEDYIPPGIMKLNWPTKHALKIPAVLVVFIQLEWEAEDWEDKEQECAQLFESLRSARNNRSTRFVAILEQSKPQTSVPEETITRRAHTFRTACDLRHRSSLFTLDMPQGQIPTAVEKLDAIFFDLAQQHYSDEIKRVEAHMDIANQATEHMLFVRYLFKVGFFSELKGAHRDAISRYHRALEFLAKVGFTSARAREIKTVAGVLVARMCRCLFQTSAPLEAIAQFSAHVRANRLRLAPGEHPAVHAAWIAQQYATFASLFKDAVDGGLGAIMLQHPGLYFKFAAEFAVRRMTEAKKTQSHTPAPGPVAAETHTYIGQVVYTCEAASNAQQLQLIKWHEQQYPHASVVLQLLNAARTIFETYCVTKQPAVVNGQIVAREKKLTRMLTILDLQRAKFLVLQRNFADATTLARAAARAFRAGRWWSLLRDALLLHKQCAWALGATGAFCTTCIELCAPQIPLSAEDKTLAQSGIDDVVQGTHMDDSLSEDFPVAFGSAASDATTSSQDGGGGDRDQTDGGPQIDMASITPAVECKVLLYEPDPETDNRVRVCIAFRSSLPLPLRITNIAPALHIAVDGDGADDDGSTKPGTSDAPDLSISLSSTTALIPNSTKVVELWLATPPRLPSTAAVVCTHVRAAIVGTHPIALCWSTPDASMTTTTTTTTMPPPAQLTTTPWSALPSIPKTAFVPQRTGVRITHAHTPPAFVGERYRIAVTVANTKSSPTTDATFRVEAGGADGSPTTVDLLQVAVDGKTHTSSSDRLSAPLPDIQANASQTVMVDVLVNAVGHLAITTRLEYTFMGVECVAQHSLSLPIVTPLHTTFQLLDTQGESLDHEMSLPAGQDMCVGVQIETTQPERLVLVDAWLQLPWAAAVAKPLRLSACHEEIGAGERVSDLVRITLPPLVPGADPTTTALGTFHIKWRRATSTCDDGDGSSCVETTSTLPMVDIHPSTLDCRLHSPT